MGKMFYLVMENTQKDAWISGGLETQMLYLVMENKTQKRRVNFRRARTMEEVLFSDGKQKTKKMFEF